MLKWVLFFVGGVLLVIAVVASDQAQLLRYECPGIGEMTLKRNANSNRLRNAQGQQVIPPRNCLITDVTP